VSQRNGMLGPRVDLTSLDTSKPRPWTPGAARIMRPGLRVIWFGPRGAGKSLALLILALQVIEEGGHVFYLDLENGELRMAERLQSILAARPAEMREAVVARLDYRPRIHFDPLRTPEAVTGWAEQFDGADLVIIDSAARALGQLGLDEEKSRDYARFTVDYIDPLVERGAGVIVADNTGWSEAERSRGASGKWDLAELVFKVSGTDFSVEKTGTITLDRKRARDGDEAIQLVAHVGGGVYSDLHQPAQSERDAAIRDAILAHLAEHPGATTEEVAKSLRKRPSRIRDECSVLEAIGTVTQCPSQTTDARGVTHTRKGWYLASESQIAAFPENGTGRDGHYPAVSGRPVVPPPTGGTGTAPDADEQPANGLIDQTLARFGGDR